MFRKKITFLAMGVAVALFLGGCFGSSSNNSSSTASGSAGAIPVVASTNVYGSLIKAIGGSKVDVVSIINDPNKDPHDYEATPQDQVLVKNAKFVVYNGGGYDDFMQKLVSAANKPKNEVLDATDVFLTSPTASNNSHIKSAAAEDHSGHHHGSDSGVEVPAGFNEHVWFDVKFMKELSGKIAAGLEAVDPDSKAEYAKGLESLDSVLQGLIDRVEAMHSQIHAQNANFRIVATEPLAGHLLGLLHIHDDTPAGVTQAVESGTDIPAAKLKELLDLMAKPGAVKALVYNTQTVTNQTQEILKAAKADNLPVIDLSETLSGSQTYTSMMNQALNQISSALKLK